LRQTKFHIHIYTSVYVTAFYLKLRVHSQGMIKVVRHAWKMLEMSCLSKTWSEVVSIHSWRVI